MNNLIWVTWLVCCLVWIDPVKPRWALSSGIGLGVGFALNTLVFYLALPSLVPMGIAGAVATNLFMNWLLRWIVAEMDNWESKKKLRIFAAIATMLFVGVLGAWLLGDTVPASQLHELPDVKIGNDAMLNTTHIPVISSDNAKRLANNNLGNYGDLFGAYDPNWFYGNGQLQWLIRLDYSGDYKAWKFGDNGTPGYIMISAENATPTVNIVGGMHLRYTPYATWGYNLQRHVYAEYPAYFASDPMFQLDNTGKPVYITALSLPTIWGTSGNKPVGIVITDPENGKNMLYDATDIPAWVQRTFDPNLPIAYLSWWGNYVHGWWNQYFAQRDIKTQTHSICYETEKTGEITISGTIGEHELGILADNNGRLYYTATMTNPNMNSYSMTDYMVVDAKTLPIKITRLPRDGLISDIGAAQNIQQMDGISHVAGYKINRPYLYSISGRDMWLAAYISSYKEVMGIGGIRTNGGKAAIGNNVKKVEAQLGP